MNFSIEKGLIFKTKNNDNTFIIEDFSSYSDSFSARNIDRKITRSFRVDEFINKFDNGEIVVTSSLNGGTPSEGSQKFIPNRFSQEELKKAEERRQWIEASIDEKSIWITNKVSRDKKVLAYARSIGMKGELPSDKSLKRWYTQWRSGGKSIESLIPKISKRGNRNSKISGEVKELIKTNIKNIYMKENRPSISATYRVIVDEISKKVEFSHLEKPSRSAVERMIKEISEYDRCAARYGYLAAKRNFPHGSPVKRIRTLMETVEIDHTPIDLDVRSRDRTVVHKRVWLTIVEEKLTRAIVGYYLAAHEPSAISVIRAIKSMVIPKENILAEYPELEGEYWPTWGLPSEASMDNGTDLHAKQTKNCLANLGVIAHFNPKGQPNYKGCVETLQGTANTQTTELMPGRTFSNYIEKEDYKSGKNSILTIDDLEKIFLIWVVKIYHQNHHRGLRESPISAWDRMKEDATPIRMPADMDFEKFLWKPEERDLQKYGVDVNTFKYNSVELQKIAKKIGYGKTIEVYVDHCDISVVHIRIPDSDHYIDAFAKSDEYMDLHLSMDDHLAVVKHGKKTLKGENGKPLSATKMSPTQMHTAWLEILQIRDEAIESTKKAKRAAEVKRRARSESKYPKKSKPTTGALTNQADETPIVPNIEDL